jgi:predicted pyridoxine 5'-phosphate oxidase superfamily flavin-nucleotide-binding protein
MAYYHDGMRELQDRYEGREVPDRLAKHRMRQAFNDVDRELIETAPFFFLATSSEESVDSSFKGIVTLTRLPRNNTRHRRVSSRSSHSIPPAHRFGAELAQCSA